ncbi:MAG: methylated-DNA--[protein]-cysteine S-methyltransferase [Anaerolineales bacterium]|jgi:methylated-DNA-[protein]-cysteine S-methyltransferase
MSIDNQHLTSHGQPLKIFIGQSATTPLGPIWVAASERGLVAVGLRTNQKKFIQQITKRYRAEILQGEEYTQQAAQQVAEYLNRKRRTFNLRIDWSVMTPFQEQVLRATLAIPRGETRSYGELAAQIGNPKAARAVGRAEATNPMPLVIPCHRVIGADGSLHGYSAPGGLETKAWLLRFEGVEF